MTTSPDSALTQKSIVSAPISHRKSHFRNPGQQKYSAVELASKDRKALFNMFFLSKKQQLELKKK